MDHDTDRPARSPRIIAVGLSLILVAVAVIAVVASHHQSDSSASVGHNRAPDHQLTHNTKARLLHGAAETAVRAAVGSTAGAGSYAITYVITAKRPAPQQTTTTPCPTIDASRIHSGFGEAAIPVNCGAVGPSDSSVRGQAVVNTSPRRMVAGATISGGMKVAVRVDDTSVWEDIGGSAGLVPEPNSSTSRSPIPGFAALTESTLGNRNGAVAMLAMGSPNGYLELESAAIDGAKRSGTATVDGTPVTVYDVGIDLAKMADLDGLSPNQHQATRDALGVLHTKGYQWTQAKVSVDAAGYIRHMVAVHHFADKGTVTFDVGVSDIGCAGVVVIPGEQAPPPTTSSCISPDDPTQATTTTVAAVPTTTPSTPAPAPTAQPQPASTPPATSTPNTTAVPTTLPPSSSTTVAPTVGKP